MSALLPALLTFFLLTQPTTNPYPAPPFLPPPGHPRVYFTPKDLPRLKANVTKPQNAAAYAEFQKNLAANTDGVLPPPQPGDELHRTRKAGALPDLPTNVDSQTLTAIACDAFDYQLSNNEAHGRQAISALTNYLRTVVYPRDDYNNTGQTVFTLGIVYDWCYPLLTAADKDAFYKAAIATASKMEVGWPPVQQSNVTGHGPEGQIFRDLLAVSVAMYDEHPDMYALVAGRFFSRMIEPKRFMYETHMHPQGTHYTNYRGQWEMLATWIFDRIGLPKVFGPDQQFFEYWTLYARRPDGQVLRDGDSHLNNNRLGEYWRDPFRPMFLAANYFNDPYLKQEAERQSPHFAPIPPRGNQSCDCVEILCFNNPDLEPKPLTDLPLSYYFPSPKGAIIARTSWEEGLSSPAVVAEMKINEWYFANHQHLDAGAFQIYYRGALATDSGYYQSGISKGDSPDNNGSSGYGSLYDVNYNKRSVAHNVITVYDPNETFDTRRWAKFAIANDGGQRMPNRWQEPAEYSDLTEEKNGYRIAEVIAHENHNDFSYLKGDLTKAYSDKLKEYERSFLFLNLHDNAHPAAMIVFDQVTSSNPAFRKAFLLHGLEQPTLHGNQTVFKDTRPGYTGKLICETLLPPPEDTTITPIGGKPDEVLVDNKPYKVAVRPGTINEGGGWRVEISPKTPRETDYFLNVLQVGDHSPTDAPPLPIDKIDAGTHIGALIANHLALFSKTRNRSNVPIHFTVSGPAIAEVFVADLNPGSWQLTSPSAPQQTLTVSETGGTVSFTAGSGSYTLIPVSH